MIGVFFLWEILIFLVDLVGWFGVLILMDISKKYVIVIDFNCMMNGFLIDSISCIYCILWNDVELFS